MDKLIVETKDVGVVLRNGEKLDMVYHNAEAEDFQLEEEAGEYRITQVKKMDAQHWKNWLSGGFPAIEIRIPTEITSVQVKADANEVKGKGLKLEQLTVEVLNGKIFLEDVQMEKGSLYCVNGSCECKEVKAGERLEMKTLNGSCSLSHSLTEESGYDIQCENGKITFYTEQEKSAIYKEGTPMYKMYCTNGACRVK